MFAVSRVLFQRWSKGSPFILAFVKIRNSPSLVNNKNDKTTVRSRILSYVMFASRVYMYI